MAARCQVPLVYHGHLAGNGRPAYVLIMTGDDQTRFTRSRGPRAGA